MKKEIKEIVKRAVYEGQDNYQVDKTIKRGVGSIEKLLQVKCGDANPKGNIALIYKGGCAEFVSFFDSYRCTGCGGRFHKDCILKHFEIEKEHDWGRQEERKNIQALIDRAVRESKKDTERLDFLDRCNMALNKHYGTTYGWELILNHNVNRLMAGNLKRIDLNDSAVTKDSCRDAIDKAISHLTDSEK